MGLGNRLPIHIMNASAELLYQPKQPPAAVASQPTSSLASLRSASDVLGGLRQINSLTQSLTKHLKTTIRDINDINLQARLLTFNAQVEAARAGTCGLPFAVVAEEMVRLSERTAATSTQLGNKTSSFISEVGGIIDDVGLAMRGTRLSDLALTNMELVDRNLYERSCDVRWWATDSSVVGALEQPDEPTQRQTCRRLGVILDSYTVYYDLVVCDLDGQVVASGRPNRFPSRGTNQRDSVWFQSALQTADGTEFGFESVHRKPTLAGGQFVLVYSCAIRQGGKVHGKPIGVLGVVFNWEGLAQTIVKATQISESERSQTRVCMADSTGLVLADTEDRLTGETLELPDQSAIFAEPKCYRVGLYRDQPYLIAHALSPGYETYKTGWHSLILQPLVIL